MAAKILGLAEIKRRFSTGNLRSRVGKVNFKSGKNQDIKEGAYSGQGLKKVLTVLGRGKSKGLFDKALKEHGVDNSQISKRRAIEKLAFSKNSKPQGKFLKDSYGRSLFLTNEQISRNLKRNAELVDVGRIKRLSKTKFAMGEIQTMSLGSTIEGDAAGEKTGSQPANRSGFASNVSSGGSGFAGAKQNTGNKEKATGFANSNQNSPANYFQPKQT